MNTTSESLLMRLKESQNQQAWSRFVEIYTPLLYFWARKVGLQSQDASDLVQDVLTLVFRKLPGFDYDRQKSFRGWLRMITLNKHREICRRKNLEYSDCSQSELINIPKGRTSAETTWDLNYQQSLVHHAMELIKPEFNASTWAALREYVISGNAAIEAARNHDVSVWTVYAAKSRLMARLREELNGLLD